MRSTLNHSLLISFNFMKITSIFFVACIVIKINPATSTIIFNKNDLSRLASEKEIP